MRSCYLCKSREQDEIKYGKYLTQGEISVHYFCLLLTSNLLQKGEDNQGFLGFLPADIKEEAIRVAPAVCCYCKKKSANISCCAARCYKSFHLTCGMQNDCLNQFIGTFQSFCNRHVPGHKLRPPPVDEKCCICYDNIRGQRQRFNGLNHLQAPCCRNGWFHKKCLASFADSAGYFFKCPLCNDNKLFRDRLSKRGIFIPDRDAAWELEQNAYADLLERPTKCSSSSCKIKGTGKNSKLIYCGTCGSIAVHRKCMKSQSNSFHCDECTSFHATIKNESFVNISSSTQRTDENESDEDEYVEVCEEEYNDSLSQSECPKREWEEDENDESIHPMGIAGANVNRILDEEMTSADEDDGDCESSSNVSQKVHRTSSQTLSSNEKDSNESVNAETKHSNIGDAESLFDSGAETDRSANSGDKLNLNSSFSVSESFSPQKSESERSQGFCADEGDTMESLRFSTSYSSGNLSNDVKKVRLDEKGKTRAAKRYTSLNDGPSGSAWVAKRTRRQSMCTEIALGSIKAEVDAKAKPGEIKTDLTQSCPMNKTNNDTNGTELENPPNTTHSRARAHSDNLSILQSPDSTQPQEEQSGRESSEILNSATKKRSRSDSMPDTDISQNKRLKNNSTVVKRENFFIDIQSICKRRISRGRSPLSSNLCSLYAYLTPAYVKNRDPIKQDSSSATDTSSATDDSVLTKETANLEGEELFNTNKPNINKPKTQDVAATPTATESRKSATTIINYNRSPQETFFNSYSILIESSAKPKPHKPRNKRLFKEYSNQDLPNQTKIESFFNRL